jgi:cyanophycinase-like exopeptidase
VEVDRYALGLATSGDGSVVVIPTASALEGDDVFADWARKGTAHYESMAVESRVSALKTREDAFDEDCISQLEGASMFYFSGGNPAYLADTLRGSPFWAAVTEAVDAGVAIAGCSAGACFLGEVAPDPGSDSLDPEKWGAQGLRLIPKTMFGPHWNMLETWIPGVQDFIRANTPEECRLVTLDEDTAMVGDGTRWRVFGTGAVAIHLDGSSRGPFRDGDTVEF